MAQSETKPFRDTHKLKCPKPTQNCMKLNIIYNTF